MVESLLHYLRDHLGSEGFTDDLNDLAPWLTDWRGRVTGRALAIVSPRTLEDVQFILRVASEYKVPLVPQGGNTSMVGGATPDADGASLIVSMRRMNRIRSVNADSNVLVAEAGVILEEAHKAAEDVGRMFPLSLAAKGSATIGGLVSTNAGGVHVVRYGTMRALTCGIEAVLPDGTVHHGLAPLRKDNRGYDLRQLLIGSEGTLGLVTAAALKLVRQPASVVTGWAALPDIKAALPLLYRLQALTSGQVAAFELIPGTGLDLINAMLPGGRTMPVTGKHPWHVLFEIESLSEWGVVSSQVQDALQQAAESGGLVDATLASTVAQGENLWALREALPVAERAEGPAAKHDIAVVPADMPAFITETTQSVEAAFPGSRVLAFGHLGDGNVHFNVRPPLLSMSEGAAETIKAGDGTTPQRVFAAKWLDRYMEAINRHVHDAVAQKNGTLSAEHGIGQFKRDEFVRLAAPGQLHWMQGIKSAFDPLGIMNPGKLLPPCV